MKGQLMSRVDDGEISEELLRSIPGNAPIEIKGALRSLGTLRDVAFSRFYLDKRLWGGHDRFTNVFLFVDLVQRWLYVFMNGGFGTRTIRRLDLVEVSIIPNVDEPARREARVVLEMTVTEGL